MKGLQCIAKQCEEMEDKKGAVKWIKDDRWTWGIIPGSISSQTHLACAHRNLASRPQACFNDSSEGPVLPVGSIQQVITIISTVVMIMYRAKISNHFSRVY